jgi:glycosyltransferase involved in cell wall biosynthesis
MAPARRQSLPRPDILCFSHLRWSFVYQRPQHLMSRFGRHGRVFFWEEPVFGETANARLEVAPVAERVYVARPMLPAGLEPETVDITQRLLLRAMLRETDLQDYVLWYYTPLAIRFTSELAPAAVVYDCMDELSKFKGASAELPDRERELLGQTDIVFTGGRSLYEAKRLLHPRVHAFPSGVDVQHFSQARAPRTESEPGDQADLPRPRIGYLGVIDERLDQQLLDHVARQRPDWQIVLAGPVVKIDPRDLPRRPNIHYLGAKTYASLPSYLAGWDVALVPFALNEATRFISPTKIPEYLAAGLPVVSAPIRDVVRPYGQMGLVRIAGSPGTFVREIDAALAHDRADLERSRAVDGVLRAMSWDCTWTAMDALLQGALERRSAAAERRVPRKRAGARPPTGPEIRP